MSAPLDQQIRALFNQARLFRLSREEIDLRSKEMEEANDPVEVYALMRSTDPMRLIYKYPVSKEEDLRIKLAHIFEQAKVFNTSEPEIQYKLFELINEGHSADDLTAAMAVMDPERRVFDHPIKSHEKGINGFELWQNRYRNVSDTYGHQITRTEEISEEFVQRCEELWEDGVLYHHGGLSVDRQSGKGGYTVVVALDHRVKPVQADLDALKAKHDLDFECISMVLKHDPKAFGASVVMAALITDMTRLSQVPNIFESMEDVCEKWVKRFERNASQDESPSP